MCLRPRSNQYQSQHSLNPGESPSQSAICRRCRVQDVTPDGSKSVTNRVALTANPGKAKMVKPREASLSDHQSTMAKKPVKGDAEMSEDARSLTPSSPRAEEVVRGIKVIRIPSDSKRMSSEKSSGARPKAQRRYTTSSEDGLDSSKQTLSPQTRLRSRGRTMARQSHAPKRSNSDKPNPETKQTYDGVMEDLEIARDAAEEARRELRRCRRLSEDIRAYAARRAASMHRDRIPECQFSYIVRYPSNLHFHSRLTCPQKPPVGLSEPSSKIRSKRRERIQRDSHRREGEFHHTDSEAELSLPAYARVNRNDRYGTYPAHSSSTVSNAPSYIRVPSKRQPGNQSGYSDDEPPVPPPNNYTSNEAESYQRRHSPSRGRTKVKLRGILRTPSDSRRRTSSDRGSSSTGPRVKFAIRTYSPDEDRKARRDTIPNNMPLDEELRHEKSRTRRRPRTWDDVQRTRAHEFEAQGGPNGFSESAKTMHPQGFDRLSRGDGDDDDDTKTIHPRAFGMRRRDHSSSSGDEMEEWRSRARQRSLRRGERLRADYRV